MPKRKRDFKLEYQRRIKRGLARGLSRSQARGHPKPNEPNVKTGLKAPKPDARLEAAVKLLRDGKSQRAAAQEVGVTTERLRRFTYGNNLAKRVGNKWVMTDERPRRVPTLTKGDVKAITVPGFSEASKAGSYWNDVGQFIRTNEVEYILPYIGDGLLDTKGKLIPFETEPNALQRIAAMDTPPFHEIYQIISPD
jgi:hypothetical protein